MARGRHELALIVPDWPAPPGVRALCTTRVGGVSGGPYATLNLGDHVGDEPGAVARNRARLAVEAGLPAAPLWLRQVHGTAIASADASSSTADGSVATEPGQVCVVLTADCLPVLLCDRAGGAVAALHAGWRGLAAGILEAGVAALAARGVAAGNLLAWLGPAIGPAAYEVGAEVRSACTEPGDPDAFAPNAAGRWQLDLYALARNRLGRAGVPAIHGGGFCTAGEPDRFFSHRRDGACGRQASLIWLAD